MTERIISELEWRTLHAAAEESVKLRELLRDTLAELETLAGEPVPGEQFDYQKCARGAVDFLHQKLRLSGIRLSNN